MTTRTLLKACYYIGAVVDLVAVAPLLSGRVAALMYGIAPEWSPATQYIARVGASLMLGWALLLFWGSRRPEERKDLLLLTVCPVLLGLVAASIFAVTGGAVAPRYMLRSWIFYALVIPLYLGAYLRARAAELRSQPASASSLTGARTS